MGRCGCGSLNSSSSVALRRAVQARAVGDDLRNRHGRGGAGWRDLRAAHDFNDAQPAAAPRVSPSDSTASDVNFVGAGDFQDGLSGSPAQTLPLMVRGIFLLQSMVSLRSM